MVVEIRGLYHHYRRGDAPIRVLEGVDLVVNRGEFLAVMGASGSGKSTLLHILGCLQQPVRGSYRLNGEEITTTPERRLAQIRARHIGQVFQVFHLLPHLDVAQNVALPFLYTTCAAAEAQRRVNDAVAQVGLQHRRGHKPSELSGGEMQRTAIARALAQEPELVLADEPTGNLDERSSSEILDLFARLNRTGHTIVMVTHDSTVASQATRTLLLRHGTLHPA